MNNAIRYAYVLTAFAALALVLFAYFVIKLRQCIRTGGWREHPRETSKQKRARRRKRRKFRAPSAGTSGATYNETVHGSTVAGANFTENAGGSGGSS